MRSPLVAGLSLLLVVAASSGFAQAPARGGGPGGFGGGGPPATMPDPAEVPEAVRMSRPSAAEVEQIRAAIAKLSASDPVLRKYPDIVQVVPPRAVNSAIMPSLAAGFAQRHQDNLKVAAAGEAELLLMGDSITDFWRNETGAYAGKPVLDKHFGQWKIANFGIAGDTTQGVLYRLKNGEGKGIRPRAVMLMIGTNNTGRNTAGEIAEGIGAVVLQLRRDFPQAKILLLAVFPRGAANDPARETIAEINKRIAKLHDGVNVHYLDIGKTFLDAQGNIPQDVMPDALHPGPKGYELWAQAVKEPLTKLMAR